MKECSQKTHTWIDEGESKFDEPAEKKKLNSFPNLAADDFIQSKHNYFTQYYVTIDKSIISRRLFHQSQFPKRYFFSDEG